MSDYDFDDFSNIEPLFDNNNFEQETQDEPLIESEEEEYLL